MDYEDNIAFCRQAVYKYMMIKLNETKSRRGRPLKSASKAGETGRSGDTKALLIRAGLELMTEKGFSSTGLEDVLSTVGVPKGSFYYYYASKEEFGKALIEAYGSYFAGLLDQFFLDGTHEPLDRMIVLIAKLRNNMIKYDFKRGCLIGNLGQEMMVLPVSFRQLLIDVFYDWQVRTVVLLDEAKLRGEIASSVDTKEMAAFFWIGWEGAVLRAKLERNAAPLDCFSNNFLNMLQSK